MRHRVKKTRKTTTSTTSTTSTTRQKSSTYNNLAAQTHPSPSRGVFFHASFRPPFFPNVVVPLLCFHLQHTPEEDSIMEYARIGHVQNQQPASSTQSEREERTNKNDNAQRRDWFYYILHSRFARTTPLHTSIILENTTPSMTHAIINSITTYRLPSTNERVDPAHGARVTPVWIRLPVRCTRQLSTMNAFGRKQKTFAGIAAISF